MGEEGRKSMKKRGKRERKKEKKKKDEILEGQYFANHGKKMNSIEVIGRNV